jgi:hypothetical protein
VIKFSLFLLAKLATALPSFGSAPFYFFLLRVFAVSLNFSCSVQQFQPLTADFTRLLLLKLPLFAKFLLFLLQYLTFLI